MLQTLERIFIGRPLAREAVSTGVPAFGRPEPCNGATTIVWMRLILGSLVFGLSLAHHLKPVAQEAEETVLSIIGVSGAGTV